MPAFWTFCVRIPHDRTIANIAGQPPHEFCVRIPIFVPPGGPVPPEWGQVLTLPNVGQEETRQLLTLAAIDNLADGLSHDVSHPIQQAVAAHMKEIGARLGENFVVSREHTGHRA